ncbi:hypothetical protein [Larkinella terrae]|uniref:Uncharacterized protein n=1 Tax=Larkinella terrae TaxID=2025311 RepID=A0A7K0EM14_9BACT|nr:hypothetical protein [Larkinella terrae]MRS62849.1 hypothetical protein [Larkinella terrae]
MKNLFAVFAYSYYMKIVGILCILWGLFSFFINYRQHQIIDLNLLTGLSCWGLVFIFFSREKVDDERIHQLKFHALTWALPVGLAVTHLINYFFLNAQEPDSGKPYQSISAYQSLVLILVLATSLFHYLKRRQEQ